MTVAKWMFYLSVGDQSESADQMTVMPSKNS